MTSTYVPIASKTVIIPASGRISLGSGVGSNSIPAKRVDIQALGDNSGAVVIGASNITADQANGGIALDVGDIYNIELIDDLSYIFVAGAEGDGVAITYWQGDRE